MGIPHPLLQVSQGHLPGQLHLSLSYETLVIFPYSGGREIRGVRLES